MLAPANSHNLNHLILRYLSQEFRVGGKNSSPELFKLRQIHSHLIVSGFSDHSPSLTSLLLHCLSLPSFPRPYALSIFHQIRRRNVYTYNAAIRGFISDPNAAISFYSNMRREGVFPNKHTFPLLLKSKTLIPFQIFAQSIKFGFGSDQFLRNAMLRICANNGLIESARKVFDEMPHRDVVSYTSLMDGYAKTSRPQEALDLFLEMRALEIAADEVAIVAALCAAGMLNCLWLGRWMHGFYIESKRVVPDVYVSTALLDMYLKCNCSEDAMRVFVNMPYKNSVSWSALLAGYVQCSKFKDVLRLFEEMMLTKIEPNEAALASALTSCSNLGSLDQGRQIHNHINTRKLGLTSVLGTALIDMYAKCGCVESAFDVFESTSVKDVYTWTALIFGLAMNGDGLSALRLFTQMVSSGVNPNEVTFIAVLTACSHGGLVAEGQELFDTMEGGYGVKRSVSHYGCMVDLLGRAGRLREAVELIEGMEIEPSVGVWGALFGACVIHRDLEVGRIVGNHLMEMQPLHSGRYALLSNLYSKFGDWESAGSVRRRMKEVGVEKSVGCSWIELNGVVHQFENSFAEEESVYTVLGKLTSLMKHKEAIFAMNLQLLGV